MRKKYNISTYRNKLVWPYWHGIKQKLEQAIIKDKHGTQNLIHANHVPALQAPYGFQFCLTVKL